MEPSIRLRDFDFYIMRGLPGSGKTHTARTMQQVRGGILHSTDDFFTKDGVYAFDPAKLQQAHGACFKAVYETARAGAIHTVFVDNTNLSALEVAPYWQIATAWGFRPIVLTVECNLDLAFGRNLHGVPRGTFDKMTRVMYLWNPAPWWMTASANCKVCSISFGLDDEIFRDLPSGPWSVCARCYEGRS